MGGAVETGEGPVGVDQTDYERDAVRRPASVVHKVCKDELSVLVSWCCCWDSDGDHEKGYQRGVERYVSDCWERLGIAVEDEAEGIDDLVSDKDVPWKYGALSNISMIV